MTGQRLAVIVPEHHNPVIPPDDGAGSAGEDSRPPDILEDDTAISLATDQ